MLDWYLDQWLKLKLDWYLDHGLPAQKKEEESDTGIVSPEKNSISSF